MKSVFMMSAANIKNRLAQSFLIGLTILLASLLLATATGILDNIRDPFARMFERQNGSHISMTMEGQVHDAQEIARWWSAKETVEGAVVTRYFTVSEKIKHNGILQSMGDLMLTGHPGRPLNQDKLEIAEGKAADGPGKNELWIPTGYAYSWGIEPGDTLEIPINGNIEQMSVSAIVVDPQFSAVMVNPIRIWVSDGFFQEKLQDQTNLNTMISIRFADYTQYGSLWEEFEQYLGTPFFGYRYEYEFLQYAYSMVQNIVGVIMLVFSMIIILVSVFVIGFTISNVIISDYRVIGILKAQGFSFSDVRRIYTLQYLLLAVFAIPLGILISRFTVSLILSQMIKSLGIVQLNSSILLPAAVTTLVMLAAVFLTAFSSASKAGEIKPAEAIRNAAPSTKNTAKKKFDITAFTTLPVSLLLALQTVFAGKRNSLFMVAASAIMAFVLVFSVNTYNSVKNMDQNYAYWGFDDADVFISRNAGMKNGSHDEVLDRLFADSRVKAAVPQNVIVNTAIPAQSGQASKSVIGFVYDGEMDSIGIINLEGRNPALDNEVSLSYLTAQNYGKTVGDLIDLYVEGKKGTYLVTGIYQSLNAGGWGFRIQEAAVRKANPDFQAANYSVKLKAGQNPDRFISDLKNEFGDGYNIRSVSESGEINLSGITANMALVTVLLSIVFMAVAFMIIFNTTLMGIYSDKKSFGIYKALGMTPLQIRMSLLWKVIILAGLGIFLGVPLALLLSPRVLGMLLTTVGMVRFPFDVTLPGTLAAIPVCLAVTVFSAWLPSGKILGISPRNLIVD